MLLLAGCSGSNSSSSSSPNPSGDQNAAVTIKDLKFTPTTVNIHVGSMVMWTNSDSFAHTVTANDGSFDSQNVAGGGTYMHTFGTAGTFAYKCKIHASMTGTITVSA